MEKLFKHKNTTLYCGPTVQEENMLQVAMVAVCFILYLYHITGRTK